MTCHYSFLTQNPRQSSDSPRDKKAQSSCKRGGVFWIFTESQYYTLRSFLLPFAALAVNVLFPIPFGNDVSRN